MVDDHIVEAVSAAAPSRLIEHVEVEIEVIVGEACISVSDLTALSQGDVVPLDRKLSETAEVRVNGRVIARGEIVSVEDKFAVRITEIGK